uniref:DUF4773 domain-containing protein n=1 Tax=Rodentolepis nana TaxID=102285 RepID=A0A0R3TY67_RODNA
LKPHDFGHDGTLLLASGWELGPLRNFCVNLDVDKSQKRLPCGLMFFKNECNWLTACMNVRPFFVFLNSTYQQTVVSMRGILEVRTETHVWQSSLDMRFDLHCATFIRSIAVANTTNSRALAKSASSSTTAAVGASRMSEIKPPDHPPLPQQQQQSEGVW